MVSEVHHPTEAVGSVLDAMSMGRRGRTWPIKIYTLGRFDVLRDDRVLTFPRKAPKKPLQLLKAIIALGGRKVPEVRLIAMLWPEEDRDAGQRAFTAALHRLRKLLGYRAVLLSGSEASLDAGRCWVDVWEFERLLTQAEKCLPDGEFEDWLQLTEPALRLYQGPFLANNVERWIGALRHRLRWRFIRQVCALAHHWRQTGDWEKALACYERALRTDDLAEELYQGLMRCHYQLGNRSNALGAYYHCKQRLAIELGATPSPATETLFHALQHP